MPYFLRIHRLERIEEILVAARRVRPPLDAQLGDGVGEAKTVHPHPDGADDAGLVGVNLLCRRRDVISARSAEIAGHRMDRNLGILLAQFLNLVVNLAGLYRTAAGAVDFHHHPDRILVLERLAQRLDNVLGAGLGAAGNQPVHADQRRVPFTPLAVVCQLSGQANTSNITK